MDTFKKVLDDLGGPAAVAREIKVELGTMQQMKNRDHVPARYWPALIELARRKRVRGITHETLVRLGARPIDERQTSQRRARAENSQSAAA